MAKRIFRIALVGLTFVLSTMCFVSWVGQGCSMYNALVGAIMIEAFMLMTLIAIKHIFD